jgi:cytoskeleton protein RodZ
MSERTDAHVPQQPTLSAGTLLRQARTAQGVHIAVLAAQIKVTPGKLEALENDRYEQLLDAAFARALAQTVCRQLRLDPEPVLARLPHLSSRSLASVAGLGTPFRERPGQPSGDDPPWWSRPVVWGPGLILLAALVLYLLPEHVTGRLALPWQSPEAATTPATPAAPASGPTSALPEGAHAVGKESRPPALPAMHAKADR